MSHLVLYDPNLHADVANILITNVFYYAVTNVFAFPL